MRWVGRYRWTRNEIAHHDAPAGARQRALLDIAGPLTLAIMVQVASSSSGSFLFPVLGQKGAGLAVFLTALMAATSRIVVGFSSTVSTSALSGAVARRSSLCAFCNAEIRNAACGFSGIGVFGSLSG